MPPKSPAIDVSESSLRRRGQILDILLIDRTRTTKRKVHNIIWATDSYVSYGHDHNNPYSPTQEIKRELITGKFNDLIQPRAAKSRTEQARRTKNKAEVFTPLNIVKQMNDDVERNLHLPVNHTWQDYVSAKWLEIACGEAPFIASRYNPVSNSKQIIKPANRVGFLDRKLQVINKFCNDTEGWLHYAELALQSCYGYEWQGDSLLIARENILMTINDFYKIKFDKQPNIESQAEKDGGLNTKQLEHFAEIISWNIFQMNGLTYTIPLIGGQPKDVDTAKVKASASQTALFDLSSVTIEPKTEKTAPNPKYVKIMDWQTRKTIPFYTLLRDSHNN